ncbi:MAG: T9SS type A sorting domain-containing protein [Bacteroidia bacterium]|jgi:hypothetical protein|nr:T9SS type A sorting domain-containing protein [Bacteroidia bacterium]
MKKTLLILMFLAGVVMRGYAQCDPDPNLNATGFTPALLPYAYVGTTYNQVLSFKAPLDTIANINGNNYDVVIDSVQLIDLRGIPSGFNYVCRERCAIPGGGKSCALLTGLGDSSQVGGYRISVYLLTYFRIKFSPTSFSNQFSRIDSGNSYTFRIFLPPPAGLNDVLSNQKNSLVKAYPNPASQQIQFDLSALPAGRSGSITIIDALGRKMTSATFSNNAPETIYMQGWPNGIYKCLIETEQDVLTTTFLKKE